MVAASIKAFSTWASILIILERTENRYFRCSGKQGTLFWSTKFIQCALEISSLYSIYLIADIGFHDQIKLKHLSLICKQQASDVVSLVADD